MRRTKLIERLLKRAISIGADFHKLLAEMYPARLLE
jgi:hypothetical protein